MAFAPNAQLDARKPISESRHDIGPSRKGKQNIDLSFPELADNAYQPSEPAHAPHPARACHPTALALGHGRAEFKDTGRYSGRFKIPGVFASVPKRPDFHIQAVALTPFTR